jgi:hypothetical protein
MRNLIVTMSGLPLLALTLATGALAQAGPMQMPIGGTMTWGMIAICALGVIVLILAAVALVKYIFFR